MCKVPHAAALRKLSTKHYDYGNFDLRVKKQKMDNAKLQVTERIKQANNVLVTVSSNPSVDQLAACIGLTLMLNKLGKHGTAVFSGVVPSTIEFLQPEKTLEVNTDSLRDFIIALDKSKADKLRYKVEDKVVKIFITPYKTTINEKDLEFSQGDFNVDAVICLGVHQQTDLDQAITAHGRILHDATVISINNTSNVELGSIHWEDTSVSSLSELVVQLSDELDKNILDSQIATALLTGIVAETDRFSNPKTTPQTMSISARLMTAGANQQLVATKLDTPPPQAPPDPLAPSSPTQPPPGTNPPAAPPSDSSTNDGVLTVNHNDGADTMANTPPPAPETPTQGIHIDDEGQLHDLDNQVPPATPPMIDTSAAIDSTSVNLSSTNTPAPLASTAPDTSMPAYQNDTAGTTMNLPPVNLPNTAPAVADQGSGAPDNELAQPNQSDKTLAQLEQAVHSPHLQPAPSEEPIPELSGTNNEGRSDVLSPDLESARNAVEAAMATQTDRPLEPIAALNAQPLGDSLHPSPSEASEPALIIKSPATALPVPDTNPLTDYNIDQPSGVPQNFTGQPNEPIDALDMPMPTPTFGTVPPPSEALGKNPITDPLNTLAPPPVPPPMTFIQPTQPTAPVANNDQGLNGTIPGVSI